MTPEEIKAVLIAELAAIAPEIDAGTVDPEADLREELDIDSLDFLNLVTALHQRLHIDIPEIEYGRLRTMVEAVTYLTEKLGSAAIPHPASGPA